MTEEKNLETLSTEILETEEREAERFSSSLYERLASQTDMTEEEQTALAAEVEAEVKVLENTSSQLKKAQNGLSIRRTSCAPDLKREKQAIAASF